MKRRAIATLVLTGLGSYACASSPPPKAEAISEPQIPDDLPTWCSGGGKPCVPTREFASKLCRGQFQSSALFMFQKKTPWERRYVKSKQGLPAQNGEGGPAGDALAYGEELLLVAVDEPAPAAAEPPAKKGKRAKRPDPSIVALRWDGTCASLKGSDVAKRPLKAASHPTVLWSKIDLSVQRSLLREAAIAREVKSHDETCAASKGSAECELADQLLSNRIVSHVRRGAKLSMPEDRP